ncbi:MAG: hypothetical protein LBR53_10185 [Deltaproteobacteria bacterium]|jgi:acyl transferase domain-containing protein/3-hydroxymyristoyl/3-hydroxydecanoyl-(acyl carrier protein) dehydratase|nr:hypothetical protein [Deltaproteobacteria bacterium]
MRKARDPLKTAAVVGLGVRLAGADDPKTFWENIVNGRTFFREAEFSDFGADPPRFFGAGKVLPDKALSLKGAWRREGASPLPPSLISADEIQSLDDSLLYLLAAGLDARPNLAGHDPEKMGVMAGHILLPTRAMSEATVALYGKELTRLWDWNPFPPPDLKSDPFRAAGRSAALLGAALGFRGPLFTVDAACASSVYAIDLALRRLLDGSLSLVLAGGAAKADPLFTQLGFSQLQALSPEGVSRPFDSRASGLAVGTGAVVLALKRLDRALWDEDDIVCLVTGAGLSNDLGANPLSPDGEGQERAMERCFQNAARAFPEGRVEGFLGLVECHGTGTVAGDRTEIAALKSFLQKGRYKLQDPVAGSVKGNLGHLLSAAGAVSALKAALALKHKILPPQAGFETEAPGLNLSHAPALRILKEALPWPDPPDNQPRLALVNAFGFGGVNAQLLLEEYRKEDFREPLKELKSGPAPARGPLAPLDAGAAAPSVSSAASGAAPSAPSAPSASSAASGKLKKRKNQEALKKNQAPAENDLSGPKGVSAPASAADHPPSAWENASPSAWENDSLGVSPHDSPPAGGGSPGELSMTLFAARTVLAPWPSYESLARYWLTPEEPPMASGRRMGSLKATGFFFEELSLDASNLKLPPLELKEALPQQTLALKVMIHVLRAAGLAPGKFPEGVDPSRVGVFLGLKTDPRAADYALRWLGPERALESLERQNPLGRDEREAFKEKLLENSPPPLTRARVLGALGSLAASRIARWLRVGGPAFTLTDERDGGVRALKEAARFLSAGELDLCLVGVVDTFGDPRTQVFSPRSVWVEGAAGMLIGTPKMAERLTPLADLLLTGQDFQAGPLSGLFQINRSGFYLRHHLRPLGRGKGLRYYLRDQGDPPREFSGPGYVLTECASRAPRALAVPPEPSRPDIWFFLRAEDEGDLVKKLDLLDELAEAAKEPGDFKSLPLKYRARAGAGGKPALAILARSRFELLGALKKARLKETDPTDPRPRILRAPEKKLLGKTALMFPGAGNHYKGLGRALSLAFPQAVSELENACARPKALFQPELFWEPGHQKPGLREGLIAQCLFGALCQRVLQSLGVFPDMLLGYSLGESALIVSSGLWPDMDSLRDDLFSSPLFETDLAGPLRSARAYWKWPENKPLKWAARTIPRALEKIEKAMRRLKPSSARRVWPLIVNTPEECLVGGEEKAVLELSGLLDVQGAALDELPALHSPAASPVAAAYRAFNTRRIGKVENLALYSSYFLRPLAADSKDVAESLTAQALNRCDFPALIERAYQDGARFFIETGPGAGLARMVKSILKGKPHLAQSVAATPADEGWPGLSRLLAELWLAGRPLDPEALLPRAASLPPEGVLVTINLAPPKLAWPAPPEGAPLSPAAPSALRGGAVGAPPEDYLAWLDRESQKAPPRGEIPAGPPGSGPIPPPTPGAGVSWEKAPMAKGSAAPGLLERRPGDPQRPDWEKSLTRSAGLEAVERLNKYRHRESPLTRDPRGEGPKPGPGDPVKESPEAPRGLGPEQGSPGGGGTPSVFKREGLRRPDKEGSPRESRVLRTVEIPPNPRLKSRPLEKRPSRPGGDSYRPPADARDSGALPGAFPPPPGAYDPPLFSGRGGGTPEAAPGGPPAGKPLPREAPERRARKAAEGVLAEAAPPPREGATPPVPPVRASAAGLDADPPLPAARAQNPSSGILDLVSGVKRPLVKSLPVTPPLPPGAPTLNRAELLEFAGGSLFRVFGDEFREADSQPSRVRLPLEPLMLVDRVLGIEGEKKSMNPGRVVTEHDIREGAWYLDQGRLTPGLSMESGQADLLLSSYLGVDFQTKGESLYRLLDAEVTYHRGLPLPGETARYDIRILKFFRHGDTHMFRFEFDGSISGKPLMSMRRGCAGFFTPAELARGKGLPAPIRKDASPGEVKKDLIPHPRPVESLSASALDALRDGDLGVLGAAFPKAFPKTRPWTLPGGRLALVERVSELKLSGGLYGLGFLRAESRVDPRAWYLSSHFKDDEVMPGTLMYDASLQALRVLLFSLGWIPEEGRSALLPAVGFATALKCRGQVTAAVKTVSYEIHLKELSWKKAPAFPPRGEKAGKAEPFPYAAADCVMRADSRPIVLVRNLNLIFSGADRERFKELRGVLGKSLPAPAALKENGEEPAEKPREALEGPRKTGADEAPGKKSPNRKAPAPDPKPSAARPKELIYSRADIDALILGRPSEVLGPLFRRFDDGSFMARLPRAPYSFLDQARILKGKVGDPAPGSKLEALFTPDPTKWPLTESRSNGGTLPYAILNETALQPCGFLATFMGSALPFKGPMRFRNLGGQARVTEKIDLLNPLPIRTRVTFAKSAVLGETVIQHYAFQAEMGGKTIFEGATHFGFISPENLERQEGLKNAASGVLAAALPPGAVFHRYPEGPGWPGKEWRMLDGYAFASPGGAKAGTPAAKSGGAVYGSAKVNPEAWFFHAHFPFDPVWPGSLGLESFFQLAKVAAATRFFPDLPLKEREKSFYGPVVGSVHKWLYRGQILPEAGECLLGITVTGENRREKSLSFQGILHVDGLPIYRVENFSVRLDP